MKALAGLAAAAALVSCSPADMTIQEGDVPSEPWPFTVQEVSVHCGNGLDVLLVSEGVGYPIRGSGRRAADHFSGRIGDEREIRKLDQDLQEVSPGVMVDMTETRAEALRRCIASGEARYDDTFNAKAP